MKKTFENILIAIIVIAVGLFFMIKDQNEKSQKRRDAEYAAERAWKDPIIQNCENAVRAMADASTLKFGDIFGATRERIDQTDSGYLYHLTASDSTTDNTPITLLCYTNRQGKVVRVIQKDQF